MSTKYRRTLWFLLLLGLMTLMVFWPLYAGNYTLRSRAVDLVMPAFSHIREALLQGEWPLWNKYQYQGLATSVYPMYWNPVILFLAFLFPSPENALNAMYLFMIFLGGFGFYKFSGLITKDYRISVIGGLCYPLVGFFVVQSQHIDLITAAAWMPLLLYTNHRYYENGNARYLSLLAIGFYLFSTGTSPGFLWTGSALLLAQAIYSRTHRESPPLRRISYSMATIFAAGFLTWRIYWDRWLSYVPTPDFTSAKIGILQSIQDFSSIFLSKATAVSTDLWSFTGSAHLHMFTGIIVVALAILSTGYSNARTDRRMGYLCILFLGLSVLAALISEYTSGFFMQTTAEITTGLKMLFTGSVLLLGLRGLEKVIKLSKKSRHSFLILLLTGSGLVILSGIILATGSFPGLPVWLIQLDLWKSVFFLACTALFLFIRSPQWRLIGIGGLMVAELGISNYLNQDSNLYNSCPSSIFSDHISIVKEQPQNIRLDEPIGRYSDLDLQIGSLDRNTGSLFKKIVRDGYWPWMTKLQAHAIATPDHGEQLHYPLFYFSRDTTDLARPSYTNFGDKITIRSQSDHQWELSFLTQYEKFLILNQNYDKNWIAFVDHQRIPIYPTSTGMMKIPVKPGIHTVTFLYRTNGLANIFGVTMIVFFILILFMIKSGSFPFEILALGFPVLIVFALNMGDMSQKMPKRILPESVPDSEDYIMNYEDHAPFWFVRPEQITPLYSFDGYRSEELGKDAEYSATLQVHREALKGKKELAYRFHLMASKPVDLAIVVKTYTHDEDSYNIRYVTSLNREQWSTLEGRFSLDEPEGSLVKADFYIWNYKNQDFLIDDIEIKLNP